MNTDQSPVGYKELPNETIKDARFPPTCPVVYDTKAAKNNSSFDIKTGTVQKGLHIMQKKRRLFMGSSLMIMGHHNKVLCLEREKNCPSVTTVQLKFTIMGGKKKAQLSPLDSVM